MKLSLVKDSAYRGLRWMEQNLTTPDCPMLFADQCWGFHVLLNRFRGMDHSQISHWKNLLMSLLAQVGEPPPIEVETSNRYQRLKAIIQADSLLMIACLLKLYKPLEETTKSFIHKVVEMVMAKREILFGFSPVYNFSFSYLFKKLGIEVPDLNRRLPFPRLNDYANLIIKSYYMTHIILFNSDMFSHPILTEDGEIKEALDFIQSSADKVIELKLYDLIAEFAICLSIGNLKSNDLYLKLISCLISAQNADGTWPRGSYDEREWRHGNYLSTIALFDYLDKNAFDA